MENRQENSLKMNGDFEGCPENKAVEAEKMKETANMYFKKMLYDRAIEFYSKAIELNPNVAIYYGNRSFAHLKSEFFGCALNDATKAIELDKNYLKGYYRRAAAYMSLGKFKQALRDFEAVTKARPNDTTAKAKYIECNKIVKKLAFEKAISVADKCISDVIDFENISIEDEYQGPALLNHNEVTLDFMKQLMECFKNMGKLHHRYAYKILLDAKKYFKEQPPLVDIKVADDEKFTVCGDIHGQYYDLYNIFQLNGLPSPENPYLFNGDFVDRGSFSVECIFTLLGFKLLFPNHFFMSRGNHESETMNQMYGFYDEVKSKYSQQMVDLFTEVYNWLPLAHCINNKILVMHGGLFSENGVTLDHIRKIDRNRQPPDEGLMCELLWSDPQPNNGRAPSKRGVGIQFGPDVTEEFLRTNNLEYIIRSHEVKNDGYELAHDNKCITVFSAPNYCDVIGNKGAYINLDGRTLTPEFKTYDAVPHPDIKPMAYAHNLLSMLS